MDINVINEYRKRLFEAQEITVRAEHDDWSEEQIQQRLTELKNQIIDNETRPKWSSHLGKIWEKKRKKIATT